MVDLLKAGEFVRTDENVMKTIAETEKAKSLQGASFNNDTKE